jgi:putative copper export protein
MTTQPILAISLFFHLLATALWIGGLLLLVIVVFPETRRVLGDAQVSLLRRLRQRFTPLGNLALVVLIVTGLIQMSLDSNYEGVLQFNNLWSVGLLVKHVLIGVMILCGVVLQYGVAPALERATLRLERAKDTTEAQMEWTRLRAQEIRLTWVTVGLGVGVLAFSAWIGVL